MTTCAECRFFDPNEGVPSMGKCRRRAPVSGFRNFPEIGRNDWCGEWKETLEAERARQEAIKAQYTRMLHGSEEYRTSFPGITKPTGE